MVLAELVKVYGHRKTSKMSELMNMTLLNEKGAESTLRRMHLLATDIDTMLQCKLLCMSPPSARTAVAGTEYTTAEQLALDEAWNLEFWNFVLFNDAWSQKGHSASNMTVILASSSLLRLLLLHIIITFPITFSHLFLLLIFYTFLYKFISLRKERTWAYYPLLELLGLNIFYFIYMKRDWAEHRCYVEALSHTTYTIVLT